MSTVSKSQNCNDGHSDIKSFTSSIAIYPLNKFDWPPCLFDLLNIYYKTKALTVEKRNK